MTIPEALLVCPADPEPRVLRTQKDVAAATELVWAALHACQANMTAIHQWNARGQ